MNIVWESGSSVTVCAHVMLRPYRLADEVGDGDPEFEIDIKLYCRECDRTYYVVVEVN